MGENIADYLKAFESRNPGVARLESFVLSKGYGLVIWTKVQAKITNKWATRSGAPHFRELEPTRGVVAAD